MVQWHKFGANLLRLRNSNYDFNLLPITEEIILVTSNNYIALLLNDLITLSKLGENKY